MWVMTPYGYTSAVVHKRKPNHVMVRARDMKSLENLCKFAGVPADLIYTDFPSDYPYRLVIKKKTYKKFLCASVDDLNYTNFKSRAAVVRPAYVGGQWIKGKLKGATATGDAYVSFLHSVWSASHRLTPISAKKENDKAYRSKRWSKDGAWGALYERAYGTSSAPIRNDEPDEIPFDEDDSWRGFDATDILDLDEAERNKLLEDLEYAKQAGDEDAEWLLNDWDDLDADTDIASMTDEQFAKFEEGNHS